MLGWHLFTAVVVLWAMAIASTANSADAFRAAQDITADAQSSEEFRARVAAIIQSYREGDTAKGRQLIEQFRLPHAQDWFSEHLGSSQSADFANRYDRLYANFAESFEHTVEAVVGERDAELVTKLENGNGETPAKVLRPGAKLSGLVSIKPASLLYGNFQIKVQRKDTSSWADTFVHEDGAFRFLGFGGWPFWVWQDGTEGAAPKTGFFSTPPILISRVNPVYPPEARSKQVEGVVFVRVLVDKGGFVKNAEVLKGDPLLAQAAIDAVRQWRYKPATLGGGPTESEARADVNFSLH